MKVDIEPNVVRIRVTDTEAGRINNGPTPVHSYLQRAQWALNVVRAMGLTVREDSSAPSGTFGPIVDANRGIANRGFTVTVFVVSGRIPREVLT